MLDLAAIVVREGSWTDPLSALAPFAEEPFAACLLSGGEDARWSYVLRAPLAITHDVADLRAPPLAAGGEGGPPFQGGWLGLATYEFGAAFEPAQPQTRTDWPDLTAALYPALLAFDHQARRVLAVGRGGGESEAGARAEQALGWLDHARVPEPLAGYLSDDFACDTPAADYERAVAQVVAGIGAGEIFQANIARLWSGRLRVGAAPFELFARLSGTSMAPLAAYLRLPHRAVVSNSPERFISVDARGLARTQPIKGTRPRGTSPDADRALAADLAASAKDRAENLMIVDLMRNDLARACTPGTVTVPSLFAMESFANVHHLVSTVEGRLAPGQGALDLFTSAFPPGSITGAPKVQAMRVIARHETPRGPYCGSIFWLGLDGAFDSSVLIRTLACVEDEGGWRIEARAGAGIVADSDPRSERRETEAKLASIVLALKGGAA